MSNFKAKIRLNTSGATVFFPHGNIQGITVAPSPNDSKILRLSHPSFTEAGTFVQCTLIEQNDIEATMMASSASGIVDVYCYGTDAQLQGNYYFQIDITNV